MAVLDVAGFVTEIKDHAVDHGFHVHDERHFVETYSLRQAWEVDLHPEDGCGGPLDLHLALEVDPRVLLAFEDVVDGLAEDEDPPDQFHFPLTFSWALPPLPNGPDLLHVAMDMAAARGLGDRQLPVGNGSVGAAPGHHRPLERLADEGFRRRGPPVRHPRALHDRQPLPPRPRPRVAR